MNSRIVLNLYSRLAALTSGILLTLEISNLPGGRAIDVALWCMSIATFLSLLELGMADKALARDDNDISTSILAVQAVISTTTAIPIISFAIFTSTGLPTPAKLVSICICIQGVTGPLISSIFKLSLICRTAYRMFILQQIMLTLGVLTYLVLHLTGEKNAVALLAAPYFITTIPALLLAFNTQRDSLKLALRAIDLNLIIEAGINSATIALIYYTLTFLSLSEQKSAAILGLKVVNVICAFSFSYMITAYSTRSISYLAKTYTVTITLFLLGAFAIIILGQLQIFSNSLFIAVTVVLFGTQRVSQDRLSILYKLKNKTYRNMTLSIISFIALLSCFALLQTKLLPKSYEVLIFALFSAPLVYMNIKLNWKSKQ